MSRKNLKLSKQEKLQQENNLLKAKLIAEKGADFYEADDTALSPEMENEWLNYIYNYEQIHKNAKIISVYEKIGKPPFKPSHELSEEVLTQALDELLQTMIEHGVALYWLEGYYDDRLIYDFITEELFDFEIEDMKMDGLFTSFTYEDFYMNHDYDLRIQTEDFITGLLRGEWREMHGTLICDELTDANGKIITKEHLCRNIKMFQQLYRSFNITEEKITDCTFDLEKRTAIVETKLSYNAIAKGGEISDFSGKMILSFQMDYDYWDINKVLVPGFNC